MHIFTKRVPNYVIYCFDVLERSGEWFYSLINMRAKFLIYREITELACFGLPPLRQQWFWSLSFTSLLLTRAEPQKPRWWGRKGIFCLHSSPTSVHNLRNFLRLGSLVHTFVLAGVRKAIGYRSVGTTAGTIATAGAAVWRVNSV